MEEFRNRVSNLQEKSIDEKIQAEIATAKPVKTPLSQRPSQKSILKGIVVQKRKAEPETNPDEEVEDKPKKKPVLSGPPMKCIGILPGISSEYAATDSEDSSESDDGGGHSATFDLAGRPIHKHCGEC